MKKGRFAVMQQGRRLVSLLLGLAAVASLAPGVRAADGGETVRDVQAVQADDYAAYLARYPYPAAAAAIELRPEEGTLEEGSLTAGEAFFKDAGRIVWTLDIPASAQYYIAFEYTADSEEINDIELSVLIDGTAPYAGMQGVLLNRLWKNDPADMDGDRFTVDRQGNHRTPEQIVDGAYQTVYAQDHSQPTPVSWRLALEAGRRTLELDIVRGGVSLKAVHLAPAAEASPRTYEQYLAAHQGADYTGEALRIEAESALLKSASYLVPDTDRGSPSTSPSDPVRLYLNVIGCGGTPGEWVEWTIDAPEAGYYNLGLKFRQNQSSGMFSTRMLFINGELPFEDMAELEFNYKTNWQSRLLSDDDGTAYKFYFNKGKNTLRLQVTSGRAAGLFARVEQSIQQLNTAYRRIIMLTSTTPDPLRNYRIDQAIPDVMELMAGQAEELAAISSDMETIVGKKGSANTMLDTLATQLNSFIEKPLTIPSRLDAFNANISALASWYYSTYWFPLELDFLTVSAPGSGLPDGLEKPNAGFFARAAYEIRAFIGSFTADYTSLEGTGDVQGEAVNVWVNSSRHQAGLIKKEADKSFTQRTGIPVNISITSAGTGVSPMLLATAAGTGPDVGMFLANGEAVSYASRGAALDLSRFGSYDTVSRRFMASSLEPYEYRGGHYGLPDTANFQMMYVRRDILDELGLDVPETWDDMRVVLSELQKTNMSVGYPPDFNFLAARIYQTGGELYNEDRSATLLDSAAAMDAFRDWTNLYTSYGVPLDFDAANRFRTGEMPIVISLLDFYPRILWLAPELSGLWEMHPIPGTRRDDGTVDHTGIAVGVCSIILSTAKNPDDAWQFLDWWTSTESQVQHGRQIESLVGSSGRFLTANVEAMRQLPWTKAEQGMIEAAWKNTRGIPEVPGGYYLNRSVDFALRNVVNNKSDPQETLKEYTIDINKEILTKRREFGLE